MALFRVVALFAVTALAEIVGCYLTWLVIKQGKTVWLLIPAAVALAWFAWLLTLHPTAAGRTYAAYGGVYIAMALVWLWLVDGITLTRWDIVGAGIALIGMAVTPYNRMDNDGPSARFLRAGNAVIQPLERSARNLIDNQWCYGGPLWTSSPQREARPERAECCPRRAR